MFHELITARRAAREAGELQRAHFGAAIDVQMKSSSVDLVTEIDTRSEAVIRKHLTDAFPKDAILGEEGGAGEGTSGRRWIVDPLDGTLNYAHHFPHFAVSIALECAGEPLVGVVYDPMRDEMFTAVRGAGTRLNDRPVRVSDRAPIGTALLATGFAYAAREDGANLPLFEAMLLAARGVRRAGAAALDLAFVAAGRLDGFWELTLKPWDTAAGVLLVREAGGVATDAEGGLHRPDSAAVVAAGPSLHPELLERLRAAGLS